MGGYVRNCCDSFRTVLRQRLAGGRGGGGGSGSFFFLCRCCLSVTFVRVFFLCVLRVASSVL